MSARVKICRSVVAAVLAGAITLGPVSPAFGQNAPAAAPQAPAQPAPAAQQPGSATQTPGGPYRISTGRDYSRAPEWFPHVLTPYFPIHVPEPELGNTPRIDQMIQSGKLQLSLQDAVALALENNLDILVNRYYSWMAETDVLRTRGGGAQRGVSIVTTPLAFVNTNVPTLSFDPIVTSTLSIDSKELPVNNPLTSGTGTSSSGAAPPPLFTHAAVENFGYAQAFHTGTQFDVSWDTTRTSTTSAAVRFNPSVQSTGNATFIQPLLAGFGRLVNERYIRMAIITKNAVDAAFLQTLITDITAVEDDYWELVFARGNVTVQQQAVGLAQRLYDDNKKQVEVGTLAPLEIVRAEAQLATAQQGLITAQTAQLQEQALLMSVITKVPAAPELRNVEIIPTDTTENPPLMENLPLADAVTEALANRPDVSEEKLVVKGDDLNVKVARNGLLPNLALSAYAQGVGLGGIQKPTTITPLVPGGFGGAANQLFQGQYPEFEAQLGLTLPIRNRVAAADSARAQLAQRQDEARLQQLANTVEVDVQNAIIALQQDRAALIAAQKTTVLQQETLDADQRRLELGASTIFVVVTDQQALSAAASAEVRAMANLAEARINFERAMGRTLSANRITVADAKSGIIQKDTLIPGTNVTGQLIGQKLDSNAVENPSR